MLSCRQEIITLFFISSYYDSYLLFLHFSSGWHLLYNIMFFSFLTSLFEYNCWLDLVMKAMLISFPISGEKCSIFRYQLWFLNRFLLLLTFFSYWMFPSISSLLHFFLTRMGLCLMKCFFRIPGILTGNFWFWNEKKSGTSWATHLWQALNSWPFCSSLLVS